MTPVEQSPSLVDQLSSSDEKIAFFRSLFRGRQDVYPRRFESRKIGKFGYAPACANEWVRGICEKPRVKCAECPNRRFLPVTDEVIRWHLSGALERSRSGRGGHVWLFFEEAVPAALARKLGSYILTETMERRPDIGFDSYDRFFPNQDTLPHGGFGNLIALPLQKNARGAGNSVFVDDHGEPHGDQWAFLSTIRRISRGQLDQIVNDGERRGRILGVSLPPEEDGERTPWTAPPSRRRKDPPIVGE